MDHFYDVVVVEDGVECSPAWFDTEAEARAYALQQQADGNEAIVREVETNWADEETINEIGFY